MTRNYNFTFEHYSLSIGWCYYYLGMVMGNYIARLPDIKSNYHLSNTLLGVILIFAAIGAISSMPLIIFLNKHFGSGRVLLLGSLWVNIVLPVIGISRFHLILLFFSFFLIGCGMAMIDVSMTSQVVILEKKFQINQMGVYSGTMGLGNFIGVLLGGIFATFDISIRNHFIFISIISFPLIFISSYNFFTQDEENSYLHDSLPPLLAPPLLPRNNDTEQENDNEDEDEHEHEHHHNNEQGVLGQQSSFDSSIYLLTHPSFDQSIATSTTDTLSINTKHNSNKSLSYPLQSRTILIYLCIIGFINQVCCGSISDWSVVYFHENLSASPLERSVGFALFAISSAVGSVFSDTISKYYSRKFILIMSGISGIIGIGFVFVAQYLPFPIVIASFGLFIAGFGLSSIAPLIASSGGDIPSMRPSDAVSYIAGVTYLGYLLGPPFFGTIADILHGVQWGYLFIIGFLFIMILIPGTLPINKYYKLHHKQSYQEIHTHDLINREDDDEEEEEEAMERGERRERRNRGEGVEDDQLSSSNISYSNTESLNNDEEYDNDEDDDDDQKTVDFANSLERLSYPVF